MLEGINGVIKQISDLNKQIESIKEMPEQIEEDVTNNVRDGLPFSQVLKRKKTDPETDIGAMVDQISQAEGVDRDLVRAVIRAESNFDPNARSSDGAIGLMQIMPRTAREMEIDPHDTRENIEGGVRYLGKMMDRFDDLPEAVAAYNAGPSAVERFDGIPPFSETQNYVKKVLSTFRQLKQSGTDR